MPSGGASVTNGSGELCEPSKDQASAPGLPVHPVKLPVDCEAVRATNGARRAAHCLFCQSGAPGTRQRPPQAAPAAGRMGPRLKTRKRPPGQQPKAGAKKRLAPRDRRPRADDEPDAHSPRLLKIDPEAVKLYRTEALARLDVVANARLRTRFRQFRVRALALSTGCSQPSTTRARSPNCASGSLKSSPSHRHGINWKKPW